MSGLAKRATQRPSPSSVDRALDAILGSSRRSDKKGKPSKDLKVTLIRKKTTTTTTTTSSTNVFQQMQQLEEVSPLNASPGHGSSYLTSHVSEKHSFEDDSEISRNLGILDSVLAMTTRTTSSSSSSGKGKSKMLNGLVNADEEDEDSASSPTKKTRLTSSGASTPTTSNTEKLGKYLAIDCEMVGVGYKGSRSVLARVSLVNFHGTVVLDEYVRPQEEVTDYRTWISGVKPSHLKDAPHFKDVQKRVDQFIRDRILVGHAIKNDMDVLMLTHPRHLIRDTSTYKPFKQYAKGRQVGLRTLAKTLLGLDIQKGQHCSVEDARVTMEVFKKVKTEWESSAGNGLRPNGAPRPKKKKQNPPPTSSKQPSVPRPKKSPQVSF